MDIAIFIFITYFLLVVIFPTWLAFYAYKKNPTRGNKIIIPLVFIFSLILAFSSIFIFNDLILPLINSIIYVLLLPLLVANKIDRKNKILLSMLWGIGALFLVTVLLILSEILFGVYSPTLDIGTITVLIIFFFTGSACIIVYLWEIHKASKKSKSIQVKSSDLRINPAKGGLSAGYLKKFEKLTDSEILTFLYFRQNSDLNKAELIDKFGKNDIQRLIEKGYIWELNSDKEEKYDDNFKKFQNIIDNDSAVRLSDEIKKMDISELKNINILNDQQIMILLFVKNKSKVNIRHLIEEFGEHNLMFLVKSGDLIEADVVELN
ncbi:MAG: hypothetical protein M0P14_05305 [Alkaliphilus sp.]|nr:hypothetical protein [Alkaliphilus sp.]